MTTTDSLKEFLLKAKAAEYNQPDFIKDDPDSIPHLFSKQQDIEIAGFFASIFAWGNRTTIINKTRELMQLMDMAPHQFILESSPQKLQQLHRFQTPQHSMLPTCCSLYRVPALVPLSGA